MEWDSYIKEKLYKTTASRKKYLDSSVAR